MASCALSENGREAFFAFAYQSTMVLYTMNCATGQVASTELKESHIVPRILTNLTGAFRGKNPDSQYVTSMVFGTIDDAVYLYGLYRDDHIRMWSARTGQCVSIVNCVPNALETRTRGSRNNLLRKAAPDMLCAFLCSAKGSEFMTIRVVNDGTAISLQQINVIPSPEFDLIEFDVNYKRIWGLWCNSQGEYNVSSYSLVSNGGYNWASAGLEILPERKIESGSDPRQAYCSYIFYPGRFQREVIDRALIMFRRSNVLSDPNVSFAALKDRVCYAVEQEVQNELKDFDVTDDLYIETSFKAWERFFSCCEQYHIKATQPIGLVNLDSIGAVTVIKKNAFSLLRPCELLEHMMLLGENVECLSDLGVDDDINSEDLVKLIATLSTLEQNISDEYKAEIDTKLYELNTPNELISQLLADYEQNFIDPDLREVINSEMKFISKLPKAMTLLLKMLQMNDSETDEMQLFPNVLQTSRGFLSVGHLFRSDTGISLVAESLHQIAVIRYALCRNLLILQQILIDSSDLPIDTLEYIRSDCMPETVVFVQAYYVMVWICETSETLPTTGNLDASIQKLSTLQLSDCRYKSRPNHPTTLLEQFLRGKGLEAGVWMLLQDQCRDITDFQWKNTLLPLASIVGQLLWAVDGNFIFGEWLIGSCQHILIQEYVRLLNSWCEWNKYSRHFIAAVSLLDNGEPYKAFDLFMQCAKGVKQEAFLVKVILQSADDLTLSEAVTQYYLRVIQLFEQYSSQDCVIQLAKAAIDELDPLSPQLAMFQSIVFANHLSLEHYEEAYHSLIANTEPSRRKDCLRQLVVCLFEKQRLDLLMEFPYLGLQEELENIIESRARSMAIEDNIYYDFLYAFYISKSTMRKAASVMYEQALRCQLETKTLPGLEHRYECLLACVTALSLADDEYRWIARPVISDEIQDEYDENDMEVDAEVVPKQKVIVSELAEIRRELLLTDAIITLAKHRKELSTIVNATPDDVISVLSNAGLYTDAIKLANSFEKPIANILHGLAFACVRATDESSNDSWAWLQENDLADIPQKNSPGDMAWQLLQRLIAQNEEEGLTTLHKAVANRLLGLGEFLPHWLFLSYRKRNASELLNLYVTHGRLVEATDLAKEYIAAMTNTGGEYFGLKNALHATTSALCFPVNTVDSLLHNLKLNSDEDAEYAECHKELSNVVNNYLTTADRVSFDKIKYIRGVVNAAR
ncbi:nuclear pore complex protein Nup160 homolog isoform X2 [Sitodiplosis mosellana]|nr:nuclear pore complex protein Nup160 homolog isoform X2 [Sitodiplosis mosellana]XP_055326414.1 nuclear pore complex protein Nup160 homolog isoform X2 [Sitodiplosis mosellana]